ncbi:hypothetical protein N7495_003690 [Penicillium taxi]|uniref:uncharacterized protein n=1 Tax=Penicillium taxi TaxID=168475 RepID=UPI0025457035|nr:uncharacterized protein N7495_003690 [Penicillium taxi]KAJ5898946.1 hypothetical protein N7495_003690 [Penicillium taxi]
MCGRYALGVQMAYVRRSLQDRGMPVDDTPEDDEVRETYNLAPGNVGAVYRADTPEPSSQPEEENNEDKNEEQDATEKKNQKPKYKLQSMKWGLIPFWTKRQPNYGSTMRTINCRDDSLIEDRGMWTTMKRRKRCIVVCQGFYEWLKKGPGGKERIPHYVRHKDGRLMCFAGLWDCVSYEGSEEKLYTYTVITTSSNPYLKFLHDRMPVILDAGSEAMKKWLDPNRKTWSNDLHNLLKPYEGELECYQVSKEVGKVGNNSPDFIVPVDSKENKKNIANFFANAKKKEDKIGSTVDISPKREPESQRTENNEKGENDADQPSSRGIKREHTPESLGIKENDKKQKIQPSPSPRKREMRSATHNTPKKKLSTTKPTDGSQQITNFFKK